MPLCLASFSHSQKQNDLRSQHEKHIMNVIAGFSISLCNLLICLCVLNQDQYVAVLCQAPSNVSQMCFY